MNSTPASAAHSDAALPISDAHLGLLLGNWAQAVWETDASGVVITDSPSWRAYTGQSLEEWLGDGWLNAIHPDDRDDAERRWRQAITAKSPVDAEYRLRAPDGGWRWTNVRAAPVLDAGGDIEKWVGMNIDVDARKRTEDALRESEARYRTLFDSIDEGYLLAEVELDKDNNAADIIYLEANPAAMRMAGRDFTGQRMRDIDPHYEDFWYKAYARVALTGEPLRAEHFAAPHGRYYEFHLSKVGPAASRRVASVFQDTTDRKQAELALSESEKRQTFLLKLSDALRPLADATEIQACTTRLLGEHLGVARAMYAEVEGPQGAETGRIRGQYVRAGDKGAVTDPFPETFTFKRFGQHTMAARYRGEPLIVTDVDADAAYNTEERAAWAKHGVRAAVVSTLSKGGRLVAEFGVHSTTPRTWTSAEITLIQEVGERTWAAAERVRAEAAMRETEGRLRLAIEGSKIAVYECDLDLRYTWIANPVEGWEASEIVGRTDDELLPPNLASPLMDYKRRALEADQPLEEEMEGAPAGASQWFLMRAEKLVADTGEVSGLRVLALDITTLKRTGQALTKSEEKYRKLFNSMDEAYAVVDVLKDGSGSWADFRFLEVNPAFTKHTSLTHPVGKTGTDLLGTPNPRWAKLYGEALDTGQSLRVEESELTLGRTFDLNIFPLPWGNQVAVLFTDVTERRRAGELQATLVAELQHRVRNLLAMIRSVVRRGRVGKSDVEEYVSHIEGRLDAMARTQAMLTRSPGENVNLESVVHEELLAQGAEPKNYQVKGPKVQLSPRTAEVMTLAIHELATNGVKYGALGHHDAFTAVTWMEEQRDGGTWLQFTWRESGVTISDKPGAGFGTELITRRIPFELDGEASLDFGADGLTATLLFPLRDGGSVLQSNYHLRQGGLE